MPESLRFPVQLKKPVWVDDFKAFIMRGNVVDLAVGVVIGVAFTGIVGSLVKDVINPVIGLITGGVDFSNHFIIVKGSPAVTPADAQKAGDVTINYGLFLNAIINFLIVAAAIFWMVRLIEKIYKFPSPAAAAPTAMETLLTEIRDHLQNQSIKENPSENIQESGSTWERFAHSCLDYCL